MMPARRVCIADQTKSTYAAACQRKALLGGVQIAHRPGTARGMVVLVKEEPTQEAVRIQGPVRHLEGDIEPRNTALPLTRA